MSDTVSSGTAVAGNGGNRASNDAPEPERQTDVWIARSFIVVLVAACAFTVLAALTPHGRAAVTALMTFDLEKADAAASSSSWMMSNFIRGAEVLATLAAAILVFLIIQTRKSESLLTILGILVIASIIIPSRDILRLANMFGRNGEDVREPLVRGSMSSIPNPENSTALARRLMAELRDLNLVIVSTPEPEPAARRDGRPAASREQRPSSEKQIALFLGDRLFFAEVGVLAATLRQRGLDRPLREILNRESLQSLVLSQSMNQRFRDDIEALRDLGVVSTLYGSLSHLYVTDLGLHALYRLEPNNAPLRREAQGRGIRLQEPEADPAAAFQQAVTPDERPSAERLLATRPSRLTLTDASPRIDRRIAVTDRNGAAVLLAIEGSPRDVVIEARGEAGLDTTLSLWRLTDAERLDQQVDSSDDWGDGTDARILQRLERRLYLVIVRGYSGATGDANLAIRNASERDRRARGWPQRARSLTDGATALSLPVEGHRIEPGSTPARFTFQLAQPGRIEIFTRSERPTDPAIQVFRIQGESADPMADEDDSDGDLDPRIALDLPQGAYALAIRTIGRHRGPIDLTVRPASQAATQVPADAPPAGATPAPPPPPPPATAAPGRSPAPR